MTTYRVTDAAGNYVGSIVGADEKTANDMAKSMTRSPIVVAVPEGERDRSWKQFNDNMKKLGH